MKGSTIFCPEGLEVSEKEELQPGAGSKCDQVAFAFKEKFTCFLLVESNYLTRNFSDILYIPFGQFYA